MSVSPTDGNGPTQGQRKGKSKRLTVAKLEGIKTSTSSSPSDEQTQSTCAKETKTLSERSEKAVDPQNTETIDLGEKVPEMKAGILRK